ACSTSSSRDRPRSSSVRMTANLTRGGVAVSRCGGPDVDSYGGSGRRSEVGPPGRGAEPVEPRAGGGRVARDLRLERFEPVEAALVAEPGHEVHPEPRVVEIFIEIEEMHLEPRLHAVDGGAHAEVRDAGGE